MIADPEALQAAALDYAERGWRVLPCQPGEKRPAWKLCPHWHHDATTDPEVITEWWHKVPTSNIGLTTGQAFDVLDVDGPAALKALECSAPLDAPWIEGPTVLTPRGWHVYVAPTGRGNTVLLGGLPGVDWRGRGGFVVAPPSVKADGTSWSWMTSPCDFGADAAIVPAPAWVLPAVRTLAP